MGLAYYTTTLISLDSVYRVDREMKITPNTTEKAKLVNTAKTVTIIITIESVYGTFLLKIIGI